MCVPVDPVGNDPSPTGLSAAVRIIRVAGIIFARNAGDDSVWACTNELPFRWPSQRRLLSGGFGWIHAQFPIAAPPGGKRVGVIPIRERR